MNTENRYQSDTRLVGGIMNSVFWMVSLIKHTFKILIKTMICMCTMYNDMHVYIPLF